MKAHTSVGESGAVGVECVECVARVAYAAIALGSADGAGDVEDVTAADAVVAVAIVAVVVGVKGDALVARDGTAAGVVEVVVEAAAFRVSRECAVPWEWTAESVNRLLIRG